MDLHRHLTAARGHRSSRAGQPGAEYDLLACLADAAAVAPQPSSAEPRAAAPSGLAELHPPSSGFGAARISPSPAAEDLIDSVGLSGEREVRVVCNGNYGTFLLPSQTVHCHCARCTSGGADGGAGDGAGSGVGQSRQAPAITPTEFERHSGLLTAKKWRNSIRLEAGDGTITIGKWLEQHNILPRPKCSGPPLGSPGPGGSGNVGLLYGLDGGVGGGGYPGHAGPSSGNDSHHTGSHFGLAHGHAVFGGLSAGVAGMGVGGGMGMGAGAPALRSTLPPSRYPASEYVTGEDDEYDDGAMAYGDGSGAGAGGHEDDADEDVDYDDGVYMDADGNHHPVRHGHAAKRAARLAGGHPRSRGPIGRAGVSGGPGASGGSQGGRTAMAGRHKSRHGLTHMRRAAAAAAAAAAAGSAGRQRRGSSSQDDGGDKRGQGHTSSEASDDSKRRPGSGGSGEGDGSGTGDVGDSRRPCGDAEPGIKREDGQAGIQTKQPQTNNQNQARHLGLAKRPAADFLAGAADAAAGLASKRSRGGRLGPGGMSAEEAAELYDPLSQQPAQGPQIRGWRFLDASAGVAADQVIMSIEINGRTFTGLLAPQQQTAAAGRPPVTGGAGALLPSGGSQGRRPSLSRGALLSSGGLARFPGPRSTGPFASGAAPAESEMVELRPEDDLPYDDGMPADCPRCALCKRCAVPRLALPKIEAGTPTGAAAVAALEATTTGPLSIKDAATVQPLELPVERAGSATGALAIPAADAIVPILTPPEDEQPLPADAEITVKTEKANTEMEIDEMVKAPEAWVPDRPSDGAPVLHLPDGPLSASQPDLPATTMAAPAAVAAAVAALAVREASRTTRQTGCGLGPMLQVKCAGDPEPKLVHSQCALWSNDVFMVAGTLCGMSTAIKRGGTRRCAHCGRSGATLCCCSGKCGRAYHLPCAIEAGATLVAEPYAMACPEHKNAAVQHTGCSSQQQGARAVVPPARQLRPAASMDASQNTTSATAITMAHGASSQPPQQVALPLSLQMSTGRRIVLPPAPTTAGSGELPPRQGSRSGAASPTSDVGAGLPALMMLRGMPSDSAAAAAALASMPPPRAAGTPGAAAAAAAATAAAMAMATLAPAEPPESKSARTSNDGHMLRTGEEITGADSAQAAAADLALESPRGAADSAAASMAAWLGHAALFARRAAAVAAAAGTSASAEPGTTAATGLFAGVSGGQAELSVMSDATAVVLGSQQQLAVGTKRPREEEATEAAAAADIAAATQPEAALPEEEAEAIAAVAAVPESLQVPQPYTVSAQQPQQQQRLSLPPGLAVNTGTAAAGTLMPARFLGRNDAGAAGDAEEETAADTGYDAFGNANGGLMLTHDAAMALLEQQQRRAMAGIAPDALHMLLIQQRHPGGGPGGESSVGSPFPAASQPVRGMPGGGGRPRHHHTGSAQPSSSLPAHARSAGAAMPGASGGVAALGGVRPVVRMDSAEEMAAVAAAAAAAGHNGQNLMHVLPRAARNIEGLLPSRPLLHNPYVPSSGDPSADLALSKMAQTGSREVEAELLGGTTGRAGHSGRCAVCVIQRKGKCGTESAPKKCLRRQLVALQRASGGGLLGVDEHFEAALHLDPALYGADSLTALAAIQQAQAQQLSSQQLGSQSMGSHQQMLTPSQQQQQQQQQQQSHQLMTGAGSMSSGALNNLGASTGGPAGPSNANNGSSGNGNGNNGSATGAASGGNGGEEGHGSDERAAAAAEQRARERARRETWSLPLGQGSGATGKRPPQPYAGM